MKDVDLSSNIIRSVRGTAKDHMRIWFFAYKHGLSVQEVEDMLEKHKKDVCIKGHNANILIKDDIGE